jgi:hypothetical protein
LGLFRITRCHYNYFIDVGGPELTGATSSIATSVVLPLDLLDFKAIEQDKVALFNWKTANERNISHFEVERSTDATAKNWLTIAKKEAQNAQNTEGAYFAKDDDAFTQSNTVLYRLKMVNQDGSFTYSKVITLQRTSNFSRLKLYPNPAHNTLQLTIESDKNTLQAIEIVDIVGKIQQQTTVNLSNGANQQTLDIHALPSGIYFLHTLNTSGVMFIKI